MINLLQVSGDNAPKHINAFEEAGLRALLLENVKKSGYSRPTPVQKYALPIVMSGRDLMASAQTGSGKTVSCFRFFAWCVWPLLSQISFPGWFSASNLEQTFVRTCGSNH